MYILKLASNLLPEKVPYRYIKKPMAPTIIERGLPICGLRPNHVCEVS
jgi:hypothetical protein